MPMESRLKTIANFVTPEDAEVARLALENEGIMVGYENAITVGMVGYLGNAVGWVKLQVPEADIQRALAILVQRKPDPAEAAAPDRTCQECGAKVPSHFEICWSCQALLGGPGEPSGVTATTPPAREGAAADDEEEEELPGDRMAWRAFIAAVIGLFVCPPLLHFYSIWILLELAYENLPRSRKASLYCSLAILIDLGVCFFVGFFIAQ
jgi:hypothetical protein